MDIMAPPVGSMPAKTSAQAQDSFEATSLISSVAIPEDEERTGTKMIDLRYMLFFKKLANPGPFFVLSSPQFLEYKLITL